MDALNTRDPNSNWGPAAVPYDGRTPANIQAGAGLIRDGRDLNRSMGGNLPEVDVSQVGRAQHPSYAPPSPIENVYLMKTAQGYIPVQNPGLWQDAAHPMAPDRRLYEGRLADYFDAQPPAQVDMRRGSP